MGRRRQSLRLARLIGMVALVAGCALPPADQPAHFSRMGRFMGLVAGCGCSDISPARMVAQYGTVVAGRYSEADIAAMKGYVELGADEHWENVVQVCSEVCGQSCMVQSVVEPLGGRRVAESSCLVSERDLHLTDGAKVMGNDGGSLP